MPSSASVFFNMVIHDKNPDKLLQLNPVVVSITNIEIEPTSDEQYSPTIVTKRLVEHAFMEFPQESKQRQVILVDLRTQFVEQKANGSQTSVGRQHFNVVVLEGNIAYLLEPLPEEPLHAAHIPKMIASQFPEHKIVMLQAHPQSHKKDVYCMVYVCMLADAVLRNEDLEIPEIAKKLFRGTANISKAKEYLQDLQDTIPNLPPCPAGDWLDSHKGALIGGAGGGLIGLAAAGPWGLLAGSAIGAIGGEVFYDSGHRAGRY